MANRNAPTYGPPPAPRRRRVVRWLIALAILALLLGAYALVVLNVSGQIGDSVENSLRSLPVLEDHHHRAAPQSP